MGAQIDLYAQLSGAGEGGDSQAASSGGADASSNVRVHDTELHLLPDYIARVVSTSTASGERKSVPPMRRSGTRKRLALSLTTPAPKQFRIVRTDPRDRRVNAVATKVQRLEEDPFE